MPWWKFLFPKRASDEQMNSELRFHVEELTEEFRTSPASIRRDYRTVATWAKAYAGRSVAVSENGQGLISQVTDPMGRTTSYSYNSSADLMSVTDPLDRTWSFAYDSSNRLVSMTDPDGGVTTNAYNDAGQVTAQTDPMGLVTAFAYVGDNFSSIGGTTTITDPHGNVEVQRYVNGFMTLVTKDSGAASQAQWTYSYDPNTYGLLSVTDPDGQTTSYTYNAAGLQNSVTDALGAVPAKS